MNWAHLRAMLWLRWRILINRMRRGGKLNNVVFALLLALAVSASAGFFVLALLLGAELLPEAPPVALMAAWGVLGLIFLFTWTIGLVTDLQRSDAMSFKNLLHLPVSLGWVFLYNYLSSYVNLSLAVFLPAMLGLGIATVIAYGPGMLVSLPLVLGYVGMITALTYQLRGWLSRLMENKRRGRNVVAIVTVLFVLLLQAPNLINLRLNHSNRAEHRRAAKELVELNDAASHEGPEQAAAQARLAELKAQEEREERVLDQRLSLAAMVVPLGWLPYGVRSAREGRWLPSGLCVLGLFAITGWSLRRSYRSTLAAVMGAHPDAPAARAAAPDAHPAAERPPRSGALLVERGLPLVDDRVAGIATACLRSLLRAPEAKMLLLSPVILLALFAFMLSSNPALEAMSGYAPMMSLGAVTLALFSIIQLLQNQFGLDRAGFRAYVLSPVPRHQILLAKNLAVAPLGLGIGVIALLGLQFFVPLDAAHFVGACLQLLSAYVLLCMIDNVFSILSPMRLKENTLKAEGAKLKTILLQLLVFLLIPVMVAPLLIPYGLELLLRGASWAQLLPLYPTLHALGLVLVLLLYRWLLRRQGDLLQAREQHILDVLTRT